MGAVKSKTKPPAPTVADFEAGDAVVILRPNLWSGSRATVESSVGHVYLLRVQGKNGAVFHAQATAEELRYDL